MNFELFCQHLRRTGERRCCIITGEKTWQTQQVQILTKNESVLWFNLESIAQMTPIAYAQKRLGHEFLHIVYDFDCGLNPDVLGLIAGMLKGGGFFILIAPCCKTWPKLMDKDLARYVATPEALIKSRTLFIKRFISLLKRDPKVLWLVQGAEQSKEIYLQANQDIHLKPNWQPQMNEHPCCNAQQANVVAQILALSQKKQKMFLLLCADRGRGKSSAMGLAARFIHQESPRLNLVITAPRRVVTASFFKFAPPHVTFYPPDQLLREQIQVDILFVDEAAAIPAAMLVTLLNLYPKIIFATTEHGYEGSGKGFTLQFKKTLLKKYHQTICLHLTNPIRWAKSDPLEGLFSTLLVTNAKPAVPETSMLSLQQIYYQELTPEQYATSESQLHQLFGLLSYAHYQTKPSDLRALLDQGEQMIWVAQQHDKIVGALWIRFEGNLPCNQQEIWGGYRRLRGHLIPQTLSAHLGFPQAIDLRFARITRIVVHPDIQSQGIGSALLKSAQQKCQQLGFDFIGAMFAADISVYHFWRKNQYQLTRIGVKVDTSSGQHSILMLKNLKANHQSTLTCWKKRFRQQLLDLLPGIFNQLDPSLIKTILPNDFYQDPLDELDWQDLQGFIFHHRSFEYSIPALKRWMANNCRIWKNLPYPLPEVLICCCWQLKPIKQVSVVYQLGGQKPTLQQLKAALKYAIYKA